MRRIGWFAVLVFLGSRPVPAEAQTVQNMTLRRALAAYDNLEYAQAITLAERALTERMAGPERARTYELLGFAYSATRETEKAVTAFKEAILLDPERQLDPQKISPRITALFNTALGEVLVVRQLQVDSGAFVGGQGSVGIRYTVSSPARVRTRALSGATTLLIDSSVVSGAVNLRWPARQPNGNPLPAGTYTIIVEASAGQNTFSASQPVRVEIGAVDTLPHLTGIPGYEYLPETEIPPRSSRPLGMALLYTGLAGAGTLALESGNLGSGARRELTVATLVTLAAGLVTTTISKQAPQPARGNILFNRLLREQLARRNAEIARENVSLRQQVRIRVVPLPKPGGGR